MQAPESNANGDLQKARLQCIYVMMIIEIDRILCLASEQLLSESANFESCIDIAPCQDRCYMLGYPSLDG